MFTPHYIEFKWFVVSGTILFFLGKHFIICKKTLYACTNPIMFLICTFLFATFLVALGLVFTLFTMS